jgi:copper chaperone CopZ
MNTTTLKITGMTCPHCAMTVTKALQSVDGVQAADVKLEEGLALVTGDAAPERLIQAVEAQGYRAHQA